MYRRRGPWRNIGDVEFATLEWIDWFNRQRLFGPLGYVPPIEFEQAYYRFQETPAAVAGLMQFGLWKTGAVQAYWQDAAWAPLLQ